MPKPDGGTRPLGIAALEDKIVQKAVVECILAPIYKAEFCGSSYGFRPKRSAHNALDALAYLIHRWKVNYVVDADIRKFFDQVDQKWLARFLEHRIADKRVGIIRWLKAGVLQDGVFQDSEVGTPQGAVIWPTSTCTMCWTYGLVHGARGAEGRRISSAMRTIVLCVFSTGGRRSDTCEICGCDLENSG